nr:MAG TPA: hypothetical protein [Caudoviricetes sp.]
MLGTPLTTRIASSLPLIFFFPLTSESKSAVIRCSASQDTVGDSPLSLYVLI